MMTPFVIFWTVMIFGSIAWYGFLVFYVGYKGGREIRTMTRTFDKRDEGQRSQRSTEEPEA